MEMNHETASHSGKHGEHMMASVAPASAGIKKFLPLIIIFALILVFTVIKQGIDGFTTVGAMSDFMAGFFLVFGGFKIINWKGFADAYTTYDIIAAKSTAYSYAYPLIEIGLGFAYLFRWQLVTINWVTVAVMAVSAVGVARKLMQREKVICACLGVVFKIPMTWVTLTEDLLMLVMATATLFVI